LLNIVNFKSGKDNPEEYRTDEQGTDE
jgi:hypothetical protein